MKNKNATLIFKVIVVMFIISIIYSLTVMYPNYGSSFDMGFLAGSFFGNGIKILGIIGLVAHSIRTIKKKALE